MAMAVNIADGSEASFGTCGEGREAKHPKNDIEVRSMF